MPVRRLPPVAVGMLAVVLLAVGAGIGAGVSSIAARPAATPTPGPTTSAPVAVASIPTPVAARSLPISAAARRTAVAALTRTVSTGPDSTTFERALEAVMPTFSSGNGESAWMNRYGCSETTGVVRVSRRGRPVAVTPEGPLSGLPADAHFRISVLLTRPASWSWVLSAPRGGASATPVAVGAGSSEAGQAQYAEFETVGTGSLTRIQVASSGFTPFLVELESCVSDR